MRVKEEMFDEYNIDDVEVGKVGVFIIYAREDGAYLAQAVDDNDCLIGMELVFNDWESVLSAFRFYSDDEWFIDPDSLPDDHDESKAE